MVSLGFYGLEQWYLVYQIDPFVCNLVSTVLIDNYFILTLLLRFF